MTRSPGRFRLLPWIAVGFNVVAAGGCAILMAVAPDRAAAWLAAGGLAFFVLAAGGFASMMRMRGGAATGRRPS